MMEEIRIDASPRALARLGGVNYLIIIPKALGVLYQMSGLSYLTLGFGLILAPELGNRLFAVIAGPAFIGEASLSLWLLVKGVNVEKWNRWRAQGEAA